MRRPQRVVLADQRSGRQPPGTPHPPAPSIFTRRSDVIYWSGRKLGCARGGGICMRSEELFRTLRALVPLYEGFLT